MLELAVLGLLHDQPLHGYELKKRLSETLGPLWGVSFGSLYPALRRLERTGAIESVEPEPQLGTVTPTGSVKGDLAAARVRLRPRPTRRTRKAYRITDAGRSMFLELLTAPEADDDRSFALRLSFARYLSTTDRIALLERRRSELAQRQSKARRAPDGRTIDRYTRSLLEHRARATQHDLDWIDELVAEERESQLTERTEGASA